MVPHLFTPFAQADRTLDRTQGGLGLGLALVKGLVELHPGGQVQARSLGHDRGAEFTIVPPTSPAEARVPDGVPAPVDAALPTGLRVLVIDDIADAADMLSSLISIYGGEPRVAYSGAAGLAAAREFDPHVVICDIGLPDGITGYDVARGLRAEPVTRAARLIALTGYGAEQDQRRSREAGFDSHLTKPVQPAHLLAVLREAGRERGVDAGVR